MKGIEFMLKTLEARDPRAKTFDPNAVVDSSFIQELEKPASSTPSGKNKSSPSSSYEHLCRGNPCGCPPEGRQGACPYPNINEIIISKVEP